MKNIILSIVLFSSIFTASSQTNVWINRGAYAPIIGKNLSEGVTLTVSHNLKLTKKTNILTWIENEPADLRTSGNYIALFHTTNVFEDNIYKLDLKSAHFFPTSNLAIKTQTFSVVPLINFERKLSENGSKVYIQFLNNFKYSDVNWNPVVSGNLTLNVINCSLTGSYWWNKNENIVGLWLKSPNIGSFKLNIRQNYNLTKRQGVTCLQLGYVLNK